MSGENRKRVLVTGASSGIGREVAVALAGRGWPLAIAGRTDARLSEVVGACGGADPLVHRAFDIVAPQQAEKFVADAAGRLGGLDVVVHCAGVGLIKPSLDTTDGEFTRVTNINMRGTFLVAQAACRIFAEQKDGLFITLPGILGKSPMKNAAAYTASKFAVTGMLRVMALEFQRQNVRFCLLHLGGVDTPFYDNIGMTPQRDKMIPVTGARDCVLNAIDLPGHLVMNELVIQPSVHQL